MGGFSPLIVILICSKETLPKFYYKRGNISLIVKIAFQVSIIKTERN